MRVPGVVPVSDQLVVLPSGGAWSGNTQILWGYLVAVRCRPATLSTRYNLRIEDRDGYEVYNTKGLQGEVSDHQRIPIRGPLTIYIEAATVDELFDMRLLVEGI